MNNAVKEPKKTEKEKLEGILLINKSEGITSFSLIPKFRAIFNEKKIGHGGTLDPLATGLMVYLIGRPYTKTADSFLQVAKEYEATILLGQKTDTYDICGEVTDKSDVIPSFEQIKQTIDEHFNGKIDQVPPMYSAKKHKGKKLYEYARDGIEIERPPKTVHLETTLISYEYPRVKISVHCSGGTYIRSIAYDLGEILECFGCIETLHRTSCGKFHVKDAITLEDVRESTNLKELLLK